MMFKLVEATELIAKHSRVVLAQAALPHDNTYSIFMNNKLICLLLRTKS